MDRYITVMSNVESEFGIGEPSAFCGSLALGLD